MQCSSARAARVCCLVSLFSAVCSFETGDFVPAARRSQHSASRTNWHDILSRQCPQFGYDRVTVLPLPQPRSFHATNSYKIQLSFHGDRHLTSWMRLVGKGAYEVPYVHVQLTSRGPALAGVRAQVTSVPDMYLVTHRQLTEEFKNASHWPKHLLVEYKWTHTEAIHSDGGLYVLFLAGLGVAVIHLVGVMITYQQKLSAFMNDMLGDNGLNNIPKVD